MLIGMHYAMIMVLSTVEPTLFVGVDSFDKNETELHHKGSFNITAENRNGQEGGVSKFHLIAQC